MTVTIHCKTRFDITMTGIWGRYQENRLPLRDRTGRLINDQATWQYARNQQSNWETINQVISLRCLPYDITEPKQLDGWWHFDFTVDDTSSLSREPDDLCFLLADTHGVPMITGLGEEDVAAKMLQTRDDINVFYQLSSINNSYENTHE